jgi:hypothetical protein
MTRYAISGYLGSIMTFGPFVIIPFIAYFNNNWWFLFGILFFLIGQAIASDKLKYIFLAFIVVSFWILQSYNLLNKTMNFFFLSFFCGYFLYFLYRRIGFGDKTSRALIAAGGNRDAQEEIDKEVEIAMEKRWAERKKEE